MKIAILMGMLSALAFPVISGISDLPPQVAVAHAQEATTTVAETATTTIHGLIRKYAEQYGVSDPVMERVVGCETGGTYDPSVQSFSYRKGVRENSWGISQIDLDYWPGISKAQALDPDFALDFMASKLSQGQGYLWSCYRSNYMDKQSYL